MTQKVRGLHGSGGVQIVAVWGGAPDPDGAALAEAARRLEGMGFSGLVVPDAPGQSSAVMPTLAWAAASTTTLGIGTYVLHTDLHHPLRVARDTAALHALSGGRFTLGLGAGRPQAERDRRAFGVAPDSTADRLRHLDQTIVALDALFAGEAVTESIGIWQMEDAALLTPTPYGMPPLLLAAQGDRMLRLAARRADWIALALDPLATIDMVRERIAFARAEANRSGRQPGFALSVAAIGSRMHPWLRSRLTGHLARDGRHPAILPEEPGALREAIQRLRDDLGITRLVIAPEHIEPVAAIIPALG
jgi:alkanesulfonate monooxygenase SsuD/methylene tetrahydromethanopterin reductase-like flavin-dependent oxidoreductase (luciferase family)